MRKATALFFGIIPACMLMFSPGLAADAGDNAPATQSVAPSPPKNSDYLKIQDVTIRPPEKELGRDALETYAYLLMIQAILDEDEAAMLDTAPLLKKCSASATIWMDGALWLSSRKSSTAIPFLEDALKAYPEDVNLNLLYAEALGEHGMAARGVEFMRAFHERHPDMLEGSLELALLLVKDKQFTEAQKILNGISAKDRMPLVSYYQAEALLGMNKRAEAITYLRRAVKGMPDFVEALAKLAHVYEQEGNLKEARATYEKLQKLQFSPHDVGIRLINLSLKMKQPEKALQYIKQGPSTLAFKLNAADMLVRSGHYLQAESILKQIANRHDAPADVFLLLADIVYEQRRNLNMAMSWLDKIPADSPAASRACLLRIQLQTEAGKLGQALETAEKGMRTYPDDEKIAEFHIRLLARDKKLDQALQAAREAMKKWPDDMTLAFLTGSLLDEKGQKKEALELMENIIKKEPENFQALNYVGFSLAEENRDLDRALELLKKANELSPNQAYIVDSLAWALFRLGRHEDALKEIRRAVKLGESPADAAIWDHYGDIARQSGKKDEARKAWRKALELKPANPENIRKKLSKI